ncbi:TPA: hypothetical protein R4558_001640 [Campylobacter jejuni]|uniref:Uncharacterized protein n=1 Tax=Campylobacter jejuni TaxID=197 RepID=A0A5T2ADJ6_CAMJU|nr:MULTISPECIES: hypothetical protein [Campylobacter]EAH4966263.1 hypothetical protein [Campylobacter coli]ASI88295.1 hypothetical protein FORC46_p0079 [Campylobacter jejuni]EAH5253929.1 hypothetical protein [Campylobacter jejuni]EAH5876539.1 hypothetical protein [Campylobacter jejuni]EAH5887213.1 hypothetical protein [Campylobacter upsaliensis]
MGFKKLSSETPKNENDFVNSARGETNNAKTSNAKRNKKLVVNFTEEEYQTLNQEANSIGLSLNSYVRFKIFRKD